MTKTFSFFFFHFFCYFLFICSRRVYSSSRNIVVVVHVTTIVYKTTTTTAVTCIKFGLQEVRCPDDTAGRVRVYVAFVGPVPDSSRKLTRVAPMGLRAHRRKYTFQPAGFVGELVVVDACPAHVRLRETVSPLAMIYSPGRRIFSFSSCLDGWRQLKHWRTYCRLRDPVECIRIHNPLELGTM